MKSGGVLCRSAQDALQFWLWRCLFNTESVFGFHGDWGVPPPTLILSLSIRSSASSSYSFCGYTRMPWVWRSCLICNERMELLVRFTDMFTHYTLHTRAHTGSPQGEIWALHLLWRRICFTAVCESGITPEHDLMTIGDRVTDADLKLKYDNTDTQTGG